MAAGSAAKVESEARDVYGLKVLVAEDSSITSDLLKLLLSQRGHQVDIVMDGLQAMFRNSFFCGFAFLFRTHRRDKVSAAAVSSS
jgi:hypothetical protein